MPLSAIWIDPPDDRTHHARTLPQAVPSGDVKLNAVLYLANGLGPHPTVLLLHGLPGHEQNLDCAQSLRRAGCNLLTIHYRGSWGCPGVFTIADCLGDAAAALKWLRDAADRRALRIDRDRMIVVGHSMGGLVAAHLASENADIIGTAVISGVDFQIVFGARGAEHASEIIDENVGFSAGLHILSGTSREDLAAEVRCNAHRWSLPMYASCLTGRPLLIVTADDGFAAGGNLLAHAVQVSGGRQMIRAHFPTDHSYSTCRIELQSRLLLRSDMTLGRASLADVERR